MTNKEAEDIAYELSGILEHRGHSNEVVIYVHQILVRIRRKHPKIDDCMKQDEKFYEEKMR